MIPNLIHPVPVRVEVASAATRFDPDTLEPIPDVQRASALTLSGQIKWFSERELAAQTIGPGESSKGYVLFRQLDLDSLGYQPKRGDKITRLGKRDCVLFITGTVPMGHYPDQGGHTLIKANFTDREAQG